MNLSSLRFVQQVGKIGASYSSFARPSSEGRTVIVTGSGKGIGKAIALRLAADGYSVCVNDLSANKAKCDEVVEEIRSMGRKACTAIADVTKRDQVKSMVQMSVKELGPLDTMVANAGVVQVDQLLEMSEKEFESIFTVNVFGVQNCLAEAAKQLISQGSCRPDRPVRGLVQAYAGLLANQNITANAYAPGIVDTSMWDLVDEGLHRTAGWGKGTAADRLVQQLTALGRLGVPEDVAKMVSFLASSDSDYITGQTPLVDGGTVFT
ncbi:hypothetical protein ONZ43_g3782 [Nemania bipapillata]|uniref:Uncharacterized protein n=1 Tax=Nemania bipapillata TaxID=110536 RepID=A0ACC2IVI4_9PEZI|nr:hypothetical protein ONZ43_g3782 [Nemania bipapillata]